MEKTLRNTILGVLVTAAIGLAVTWVRWVSLAAADIPSIKEAQVGYIQDVRDFRKEIQDFRKDVFKALGNRNR